MSEFAHHCEQSGDSLRAAKYRQLAATPVGMDRRTATISAVDCGSKTTGYATIVTNSFRIRLSIGSRCQGMNSRARQAPEQNSVRQLL